MKNKMLLFLGIAVLMFTIPQAANANSAKGWVFCDANGNNWVDEEDFGLANITVNLYVNGVLTDSHETDGLGYFPAFWADDCPPNISLVVEIDLSDPDLPADASPTTPTSYDFCNAHRTVYFGIFSEECGCPPCEEYPVKTIGYWKHNVCFWAQDPPPDNNGYQEEEADLLSALERINDNWWFDDFGEDLTMETACDVLQVLNKGSKCDKAKSQLLANMFNVERGYVPLEAEIDSDDAATVGEAIDQSILWITGGNTRDCTYAQSLADSINEGTAFSSGPENDSSSNGGFDPAYSSGSSLKP